MKHQIEYANKAYRKFQQRGMEEAEAVDLVYNNTTGFLFVFFVSILNAFKL